MNEVAQYKGFIEQLKEEIRRSQVLASSVSTRIMLELYWYIGQQIFEKQKELGWGKSIIDKLSKDLKNEFASPKSFSPDNLQRMRQMYCEYTDIENFDKVNSILKSISGQRVPKLVSILGHAVPKLYNQENQIDRQSALQIVKQLVCSVPWGHTIQILKKCKTLDERLFYIVGTIKEQWKRETLLNQIKMQAYERSSFEKNHNFENILPEHFAQQASESIKSVYNLEFLNIKKPVNERELENRLVENIKNFLLEMGYGFCFIGQQYRLVFDDKEYFIDLLFYHRFLKSLVAIELKTTEFEPEHAGKIDFYLNVLNHTEKANDDNPSIGIILCADSSKLEVEFSLKTKQNPIGVAEYELVKKLPAKYKGILPSENQLKQLIQKK